MRRDDQVVEGIAAAVHDPFVQAWRGYAEDVWLPVGRALKDAAAAHGEAMAELRASSGAGDDERGRARYRGRVAAEVLGPVRKALGAGRVAVELETSLDAAAAEAHEAASGLPALVTAPLSPSALRGSARSGPWAAAKRMLALSLRPIVWRREDHDIAAAALAGHHLERVVVPAQRRAFRACQRRRAEWLGGVERAWSKWASVVFSLSAQDAAEGQQSGPDSGSASYRAAASALQAELEALAGRVGHASGKELGEDMAREESVLIAAVAVAGTFVADSPTAAPGGVRSTIGGERAGHDRALASRWDGWAENAAARLDLYSSFLELRAASDAACRQLAARWRAASEDVHAALRGVQAELAAGRSRATLPSSDGDDSPLADLLQKEKHSTGAALDRIAGHLPSPEELVRTLTTEAERAVDALGTLTDGLPETLVLHELPGRDDRIRGPGRDSRPVHFREAALQAFDTLRMERIRTAPAVAEGAMQRIRAAMVELREVTDYGYDTAIAELSGEGSAELDTAIQVVTAALTRADARAGHAGEMLRDALAESESGMTEEVAEGLQHLIHRVLADRLSGRYLDARSYLAREMARYLDRWRTGVVETGRRVSAGLGALRGRFRPLAGALGIGSGATPGVREHPLASVDQVVASLPVVYRRLFALEPVTDPRLLAGREPALETVSAAWARWRDDDRRSLIVIAPPGSGITSFLNVAAARLHAEDPLGVRVALRERIRTETDLATQLAAWLGTEGAPDLDSLAAKVVSRTPADAVPRTVVLEGLELIHMRVPSGCELFERFLTFVSRTESRILWVLGISTPAWQLIAKRSPSFVGDTEPLRLEELTPQDLRDAILARHRLSGLPLRYGDPNYRHDALRRHTRQRRATDKQQQLIETDYFQRLHRASLGSVRLAIFQWLRSADFETIEGSLLVRPLKPVNPFMKMLDLPQCFALKALLDHGGLSVAEYCEVARTSVPDSVHLFRSMADLRVVEAAGGGGARHPRPSSPAARYRIRPIMIGAVAAHLRSLNILH